MPKMQEAVRQPATKKAQNRFLKQQRGCCPFLFPSLHQSHLREGARHYQSISRSQQWSLNKCDASPLEAFFLRLDIEERVCVLTYSEQNPKKILSRERLPRDNDSGFS